MPIEGHTRTINGHMYNISTMPAFHGFSVSQRLLKIVGPPMSEVAESIGDVGGDIDLSMVEINLPTVVDHFIRSLESEDSQKLLKDLFVGVLVDGKDLSNDSIFNNHFAGNFGEMVDVIIEIIRINFSSFFDGNVLGNMKSLLPMSEKKDKE